MPTSHASAAWSGNLTEGLGEDLRQDRRVLGAAVLAQVASRRGAEDHSRGASRRGARGLLLDDDVRARDGRRPDADPHPHDRRRYLRPDGNGGFAISTVALETEAAIPGLDDAGFQALAENAKANCPVSKALTGRLHLARRQARRRVDRNNPKSRRLLSGAARIFFSEKSGRFCQNRVFSGRCRE